MNQKKGQKEITCKTELKSNIIKKNVFEREVALCQQLSKDKKSCNWGKCKDCGVIPLLYKLHSGILVEGKNGVAKLKRAYLK